MEMEHVPKILRCLTIVTAISTATGEAYAQTVVGTQPAIPTSAAQTIIVPFNDGILPAAMTCQQSPVVAAWVIPSRFAVRELQTAYAQARYHGTLWSAAIQVGALSMEQYVELSPSIIAALQLSSQLIVGTTLSYTFAQARGFAAEHLITVNAHMRFMLDSVTVIGVAARNIAQSMRAGSTAGSQSLFQLGMGRRIGSFALDADLVLPLHAPLGMYAALRWDVLGPFRMRISYATVPQSIEACAAFDAYDGVTIATAIHYHLALGISPTIGLWYQW